MKGFFLIALCFISSACGSTLDPIVVEDDAEYVTWTWIQSDFKEKVKKRLVHQELFGDNPSIRLLQSMSLFDNKVFCFNNGLDCYVFGIDSKRVYSTGDLPEYSHHNNAQFLDVYYSKDDKYPLLLLTKGNYPPDQNECYIVRVEEKKDSILFTRIKTIKNNLAEAKNGGSWVADYKSKKLYMYAMTRSDWRVKDDNYFCVFSFDLPDVLAPTEYTLEYEDVISYWEYKYLIHQGGTFYNGYLLFNVQSLTSIDGISLESSYNVLAINTNTGRIDAVFPLDETLETEGISVFDDKIYVSHKNGNSNQNEESVVFKLFEYTLPVSVINNAY